MTDAEATPQVRAHSTEPVVIAYESVVKQFGTVTVIDGVSAQVHRGEVVCLIGPSGLGQVDAAEVHERARDHPGRPS